jgi:hypothetical protein
LLAATGLKFLPLMLIVVPTLPDDGVRAEIVGCPYSKEVVKEKNSNGKNCLASLNVDAQKDTVCFVLTTGVQEGMNTDMDSNDSWWKAARWQDSSYRKPSQWHDAFGRSADKIEIQLAKSKRGGFITGR